jgi:hypothetical protein
MVEARFQPLVQYSERQDAAASVIMNPYHPVSESLNATEPVNGGEAEGNCVAVRRGGEQPDAKEQSQTKVNSMFVVAPLGTACVCGEPASEWRSLRKARYREAARTGKR